MCQVAAARRGIFQRTKYRRRERDDRLEEQSEKKRAGGRKKERTIYTLTDLQRHNGREFQINIVAK